jgi:hypothetical protein
VVVVMAILAGMDFVFLNLVTFTFTPTN